MTDKPSYEELEQLIRELRKELSDKAIKENLIAIQRDLSIDLSTITDLNEGLKLCLDSAIEISSMDSGGIYLRNDTSGSFELLHHKGLPANFVKAVLCFESDSEQAKLVLEGKPIYTQHQKAEVTLSDHEINESLSAFAVIPILLRQKVIGCLNVASRSLNQVPEIFRSSLETISSQIGSSIDRLQAQGKMQESEEKYKDLFDNAPMGYIEIDSEGLISRVNRKMTDLFGYSIGELTGEPVWHLVVEKQQTEKLIKEKLEGKKVSDNRPVRTFIKKDGKTFPGLTSDVILKDKTGKNKGIRTTIQDVAQRVKVADALRESEAKYRKMFEHSGFGITLNDAETGERVLFNREAHERLGYTREEFKKVPLPMIADPDFGEKVVEHRRKVIEQGHVLEEAKHRKKNGEIIDVLISSVAVKIGERYFINNISVDITGSKKAAIALRESEEFGTSLLDHSPNPILVMNRDTAIEYVSPMFEKLTGYSSKDVIGTKAPFPWWVDDPRSGDLNERKQNILVDRLNFEKLFQKKNGELFWVQINNVVVEQDGEFRCNLSIWVDITARKQTEEALRESEEFSRNLLQSSPTPILVFNPDSSLRYVNPSLEKLTGYSSAELIGLKPPFPWWIVELEPRSIAERQEEIVRGFQRVEKLSKNKDGEYFWVEVIPSPVMQDDELIYTFVNWIDITDRKQAEEERTRLESQLQQAQKMESIGTLAGGIAHDFNNVLMPIMVHSEMAMMDLTSDNPLQHNLNEIFKAGERARDLVKQILTFSRKGEGERVVIKITPILKEVLKMLRSSIPTTIDIQQDLDIKSDTVLADATQIHQMVLNLSTNASHAMKENGGILGVSLAQEDLNSEAITKHPDLIPGSYLKLTVRDTGSGIDDETMQKIFEPYFTTKQVGEGTGMGLALVHGIVKGYGGDITVESELGKGTAFNVYLPRIAEEVTLVAEPAVQLPKGSERILFVDDELSAVNAMQSMLENLGYNVTARTSSIEALEAFKDDPNRFDLIITDMTMPEMTGKELAREIMLIRSGMPVILCTGFSEQIDEGRAKEMGIGAYLMKPIVMHDMASTIRGVLDKG